MGIYTIKPIREVSVNDFQYLITGKQVVISPHALWHLSNRQRKVFNVDELTAMIERETPQEYIFRKMKDTLPIIVKVMATENSSLK